MNIALCYESVLPFRGGCETYIADLARRLNSDSHEVHLYACRWDAAALPAAMRFHALPPVRGPRFLHPWRFARQCLRAMATEHHDVSVGFDKTYGQDVLYPQGGLHAASFERNLRKYAGRLTRGLVRALKFFDVAHWSFSRLERRQYLGDEPPLIVVNSFMVRDHFRRYLGIPEKNLQVVRSAIDPDRFAEQDRLKIRQEFRARWSLTASEAVGLFGAMNYRLKGLDPLLRSVQRLLARSEYRGQPPPFRLVVAGDPNTRKYERLARSLRIADHVRFIGYCAPMRNAYFGADFLVHPTFYDPCSLVVLEALACGLPVITTRANGAGELLKPPSEGYVIDDPHDHERLAWCLSQLLDGTRRYACSLAARRAAFQWTFEHHYRQLLNVFLEAVKRKKAA
jgi:UDP-glucose:(heptosyl)LPS alpha-1,3-glucosyltransferase